MQNSKSAPNSPEVVEQLLTELYHKGEAFVRPRWEKVEEQVRESPTKAVLIAAGLGFLLHRLPCRSLLASTLKLAWAFAPPAAMAALAGKGLHLLEDQVNAKGSSSKSRSNRGTAQGVAA